MKWLNNIIGEIIEHHPEGEILIASGGSPSGTYHLGHLRELITADAVLVGLQQRGRKARHIYFADDLDGLRKIPVNVPSSYEKYLGKPLCDIPAPNNDGDSYAEYFLQGLINPADALDMEIDFIRSHNKYRAGFFVPAIEKALERNEAVRSILENVSGHKLGEEWSPIQINEDGYLKKRRFVGIDKSAKTVTYEDKDAKPQTISYAKGDVKLDWRIDWPARWWLLKVKVEPFGRDHATKGGSFDTGLALIKEVFDSTAPLPIPYDFVNLAGDTKKMSASKGTGLDAGGVVKILPPEIVRYFMLRYPPSKRLYFDPENGVSQLIDEFAALISNPMPTEEEKQLLSICIKQSQKRVVSRIPFSHLVASYQAARHDPGTTLEVMKRTEHAKVVDEDEDIIRNELIYINEWLNNWAPDELKFNVEENPNRLGALSTKHKAFLSKLADAIEKAPQDADGEWFHKAIYDLKDETGMEPKELFATLYQVLINKDAGPRAGYFLSILPREWLIKRLRLED
jgi:lysyl-tRNA synthetase class 1